MSCWDRQTPHDGTIFKRYSNLYISWTTTTIFQYANFECSELDDFNDSRDFPRADHQHLKHPSEAFRRPCKNACHNCKDWAVEVGMLLVRTLSGQYHWNGKIKTSWNLDDPWCFTKGPRHANAKTHSEGWQGQVVPPWFYSVFSHVFSQQVTYILPSAIITPDFKHFRKPWNIQQFLAVLTYCFQSMWHILLDSWP